MKKISLIILSILYFVSVTGIAINIHYCMGDLADWSLGQEKSKSCSKCGMEKSEEKENGCCKDVHKFFKNDTEQKIAEFVSLQKRFVPNAIVPFHFETPSYSIPPVSNDNLFSHTPPRSAGIAIYIRNCIFLI